MTHEADGYAIDLHWIPLGEGGSGLVRVNGRIYERIKALIDRRRPLDLYHTALRVDGPGGHFIIEGMWPCPDDDRESRGVVLVAPVFARAFSRLRLFRFEVRCWRNGHLPDADAAVGGPRRVSSDPDQVQTLLGLTDSIPPLMWGRDQRGTGEMWNSNSVISWLLTQCGAAVDEFPPPSGGRAPGWEAGIAVARAAAS